jgi:ferric-dicitrate binding protein FerR (iron transport regulator)
MEEKIISDTISEAIVDYYTNQLTQSQAEELLKWVNENEDNMRHFHEIGKVWYTSGQLSRKETDAGKAWENLLDKIEDNDKRPMPKPEFRIPKSVIYRSVAAVLLFAALGIGSIFIFRHQKSESDIAYFEALAPKGSRSVITLSDGSIVWLNSGTKLRYQRNFGQEGRELYLEGEAYFVVAENKQMPFRVKTSDICITATGTAFNVKAYNDENVIETTLENGEVRIEALNPSKNMLESTPVFLKPNQKAVFVRSSKNLSINESRQKTMLTRNDSEVKTKPISLRVDTLVDTKLTTSWKDSRWIFKSEKLLKLAPILERRYDITIIFRDSVLRSYKFTGTLKEESLEQVLKAICLAAPIRYEIIHNQVLFFEDSSQKNKYHKPLKTN